MTVAWETLNGYVDGELDAAAAAEVAAEIARDPDAAARVATLHRLKAAAKEGDSSTSSAPSIPTGFRRSSKLRPYAVRSATIAACIAVLVVLGAAGFWLAGDAPSQQRAAQEQIANAIGAYRSWIADRDRFAGTSRTEAPNLADAGLQLVYSVPTSGQTEPNMFGYVGPRGCKLGLWIGPLPSGQASVSGEPRPIAADGDVIGSAWSHGDKLYVLMAKGMDGGRLEQLTSLIFERVKQRAAPPSGHVVALGPPEGPPCRA